MTLIEPAPNAPEGSVSTLSHYSPHDFPPTAAILCRMTAPLISFAMELLTRGTACHVLGRDIEAGLTHLVDKLKATDLPDFLRKLTEHCDAEVKRLTRKGRAAAAVSFFDKCSALAAIAAKCSFLADVKPRIEALFANGPGITLSTIHKAKGLEWETVFILDFDSLMPSPYASEEELEQEANLIYVAQTRAKLHLRYIRGGDWT